MISLSDYLNHFFVFIHFTVLNFLHDLINYFINWLVIKHRAEGDLLEETEYNNHNYDY